MDFFVRLEHGLPRTHSCKEPKNCDEEVRWKTAQDNTLVNNLVSTITKLSAICLEEIATQKKLFERFVLVSEQQSVAKFTFMPSAPTSPPLCLQLFLDFSVFSF